MSFKVGDKVLMDFWYKKVPGEVIRINRGKSEPIVVKLVNGQEFTFTDKGDFDVFSKFKNVSSIEKVEE